MPTRIGVFLLTCLITYSRKNAVVSFLLPSLPAGKDIRGLSSANAATKVLSLSSNDDQDNDASNSLHVIDNAAEYCRVNPPWDYQSIPAIKRFARWTWRRRMTVLKFLHWKDPLTPVDSCINLECLWWKALSTTDPNSPCFERLTYDMLPRRTRWILKFFRRWHPRWIHALLELRMAYLNQAIQHEMKHSPSHGFRIISLGAGYDVRSIRLLNDPSLPSRIECYEFDLPSTMESKEKLLQERLLPRQRQDSTTLKLPHMIGIDLNDTEELRRQLQAIFHDNEPNQDWHTIFVVEGVLMYLQADRAIAALQLCSDMATGPASLCFADRLFNFSHCDPIPMQQQLLQTGWVLKEWAPSPTANAKHMGIARTVH